MKNYAGIIFMTAWTLLYFLFFDGVLSELGFMILWFIVWIFLALPWGFLSIFGIIDDNKQKIKSVLYDNELGKYVVFSFGILLLLYGVSLLLFVLYRLLILCETNITQVSLGLLISFFSIRTGYRRIKSVSLF